MRALTQTLRPAASGFLQCSLRLRVEISESLPWSQLAPRILLTSPSSLLHVSMPSAITAELLRRGWTEADVRKVVGGNALRALRDAEELAEV